MSKNNNPLLKQKDAAANAGVEQVALGHTKGRFEFDHRSEDSFPTGSSIIFRPITLKTTQQGLSFGVVRYDTIRVKKHIVTKEGKPMVIEEQIIVPPDISRDHPVFSAADAGGESIGAKRRISRFRVPVFMLTRREQSSGRGRKQPTETDIPVEESVVWFDLNTKEYGAFQAAQSEGSSSVRRAIEDFAFDSKTSTPEYGFVRSKIATNDRFKVSYEVTPLADDDPKNSPDGEDGPHPAYSRGMVIDPYELLVNDKGVPRFFDEFPVYYDELMEVIEDMADEMRNHGFSVDEFVSAVEAASRSGSQSDTDTDQSEHRRSRRHESRPDPVDDVDEDEEVIAPARPGRREAEDDEPAQADPTPGSRWRRRG